MASAIGEILTKSTPQAKSHAYNDLQMNKTQVFHQTVNNRYTSQKQQHLAQLDSGNLPLIEPTTQTHCIEHEPNKLKTEERASSEFEKSAQDHQDLSDHLQTPSALEESAPLKHQNCGYKLPAEKLNKKQAKSNFKIEKGADKNTNVKTKFR